MMVMMMMQEQQQKTQKQESHCRRRRRRRSISRSVVVDVGGRAAAAANRPPCVLPDEIVEGEILTRLPTKALLRFRSVSKQWLSLISSDPIFIQSQSKHVLSSDDDPNGRHWKLMLLSPSSSQFHSLDDEDHDHQLLPDHQSQQPYNYHDDDDDVVSSSASVSSSSSIGSGAGAAHLIKAHQFSIPVSAPLGVSVIGSCNGLLCISIIDHKYCYNAEEDDDDDEDFIPFPDHRENNDNINVHPAYLPIENVSNICRDAIIWNPLFKSYHKVVRFFYSTEQGCLGPLVGFGCSTVVDKHEEDNYKLIQISDACNAVLVYTVKTKSWRTFQLETPPNIVKRKAIEMCWDNVGTFFNGSLYWFSTCKRVLVEFDLKSEKFRTSPKVLDDDVYTRVSPIQGTNMIVVRGECLGLFVADHDGDMNELYHEYFYLFMMKPAAAAAEDEDLVDNDKIICSWSMLKIQHPQGRICKPICSMASGELLMRIIINNNSNIPSAYQRYLLSICEQCEYAEDPETKRIVGTAMPNLEKGLDMFSAKDGMIIYNPEDGRVKNLEVHGATGELYSYVQYIQTFCCASPCSSPD